MIAYFFPDSGNRTIKFHRCVLMAASRYFKGRSHLLSQGELTLHPDLGVKHKDLSLIKDFIYGGEVSVEETNIPSFLRSAKVTSKVPYIKYDRNLGGSGVGELQSV